MGTVHVDDTENASRGAQAVADGWRGTYSAGDTSEASSWSTTRKVFQGRKVKISRLAAGARRGWKEADSGPGCCQPGNGDLENISDEARRVAGDAATADHRRPEGQRSGR